MSESHRPTVAICLPSLRGGGAERACLNLAEALADRGETVDLVLADGAGQYHSLVPPTVRTVGLGQTRVSRSIPAMVRYLRRERPRALISAMAHLNLAVLWARRLAGSTARVIITERNPLSFLPGEAGSPNARLIPLLARLTYPAAEAIVAVSSGVADDLARVTGLHRRRIKVIYNPIPMDRIRKSANAAPAHAWFAPDSPPVVLGVGRLVRQKDFPTLISAFALVRQSRNLRLMILGEGLERPKLHALIIALGLTDVARMPGFTLNPYPAMKHAAIVAMTSAWEGFGNVLVEAMALGTPVTATRCPGGVSEILDYGSFGRLCPIGDPRAMADSIALTLEHPLPADVLTKRAGDFSVERSANAYLELLHA